MHSFQELPQKVGSEEYFDREKYIFSRYLFIYHSPTIKIDLSESYIQDNLKVITCRLYDCPAATLNCEWYLLKDALHRASRCRR